MVAKEANKIPHDNDAEEAVLGSLLIDGSAIKGLNLKPDDFFNEQNRILFTACSSLKERNVSINQITLSEELERNQKLKAFGVENLARLLSVVPTSLDIEYYAEIVHRHSVSRKLISAGQNIAKLGMMASPDVSVTLSKADDLILDIRRENTQLSIITPQDRAKMLDTRYEALFKAPDGVAYATGLSDLDWALGGGFYSGDLIIVGARPQVGKTTFIQNIANHIGMSKNVLFCSGEMDVGSLSDRDIAGITGYPLGKIRFGNYDEKMYTDITGEALEQLRKWKVFYFEERKGFSTAQIYQAATQMQVRYGLNMIVIDYLGLLTDTYGQNQNDRLGYITRTLKEIARTLHVPVVAAHQLSRALEMRQDKRPELWDLRESGNIEQDADIVLFLYRDSYYDKSDDNKTEIIIGKHRQGAASRKVMAIFDQKKQKYFGISQE